MVLDKANFTVIGTVSGSAKASYILGIGGLSQKSLKGNAVTEMYENANLTGSQAIINVVFKQRVSNVLIYSEIEYTASGTIIEFFDGARPSAQEALDEAAFNRYGSHHHYIKGYMGK